VAANYDFVTESPQLDQAVGDAGVTLLYPLRHGGCHRPWVGVMLRREAGWRRFDGYVGVQR